ncbi:hypothetical protein EMIT043CA1_30316 [Pseudomonas brassicacearum]
MLHKTGKRIFVHTLLIHRCQGKCTKANLSLHRGHPQGTLELFHVEKGTLKCLVGETELVIPAGSSAVAKTDVPHSYSNAGRSKLVFTMSVTEMHQ